SYWPSTRAPRNARTMPAWTPALPAITAPNGPAYALGNAPVVSTSSPSAAALIQPGRSTTSPGSNGSPSPRPVRARTCPSAMPVPPPRPRPAGPAWAIGPGAPPRTNRCPVATARPQSTGEAAPPPRNSVAASMNLTLPEHLHLVVTQPPSAHESYLQPHPR